MDLYDLKHWSDCAVYNEPAYPNGDCDCGAAKARKRWWVYSYHLSCIQVSHFQNVFQTRLKRLLRLQ